MELYKERGPVKLWHRKCMNKGCNNEFETSYAPERPEIVYCESCYNQEVYWNYSPLEEYPLGGGGCISTPAQAPPLKRGIKIKSMLK